MATRIVMLSAASRTCPLSGRTEIQDTLLDLLRIITRPERVEGRSFPEFLASAVEAIRGRAATEIASSDAVEETLSDIDACEPRDLIGELYSHLVGLASRAYEDALEEPLDVPLDRTVAEQAPKDYPFPVSGGAPPSRSVVMLTLYARDFDLQALGLVPRVLAHELVCHIGARHVGIWQQPPVPDFRTFFSDGFMDCAVWQLLLMWLESRQLPHITPLGHLSEAEIPYAHRRPDAFRAGRGAWAHCRAATSMRLIGDPLPDIGELAVRRAASEAALNETALNLNACDYHIAPKDKFAHLAQKPAPGVTERFADVATGLAAPSDLFDYVLDEDPDAEFDPVFR